MAGEHLHYARLTAFLAQTDFERYFDRAVMIAALVLLWPLLRALRIENFGHDLGLRRPRHGWKQLGVGFLLAIVPLLILGGISIPTRVYRPREHIAYGKLAWLPVIAVVVAVLEEFLFRGALQGAVRKTTVDGFALAAAAVLFAAVHFLKPPDHGIERRASNGGAGWRCCRRRWGNSGSRRCCWEASARCWWWG